MCRQFQTQVTAVFQSRNHVSRDHFGTHRKIVSAVGCGLMSGRRLLRGRHNSLQIGQCLNIVEIDLTIVDRVGRGSRQRPAAYPSSFRRFPKGPPFLWLFGQFHESVFRPVRCSSECREPADTDRQHREKRPHHHDGRPVPDTARPCLQTSARVVSCRSFLSITACSPSQSTACGGISPSA